jgi:predicted nucleic acid-binding protein
VILVDSSIWIDHLRARDERLITLLQARQVLSHPFVIGELALGDLPRRDVFLSELQDLTQAATASDDEVLDFINRLPLFGRGIGYVDAHLLTAVRLTPDATLWTAETRLRAVAAELGVAARLPH